MLLVLETEMQSRKKLRRLANVQDLLIEIQRMWNMIPAKTGTKGAILKSLRQYLSNIPGKHEIKELQKTAILGIAHILREVVM
jgi:hypothetical protein